MFKLFFNIKKLFFISFIGLFLNSYVVFLIKPMESDTVARNVVYEAFKNFIENESATLFSFFSTKKRTEIFKLGNTKDPTCFTAKKLNSALNPANLKRAFYRRQFFNLIFTDNFKTEFKKLLGRIKASDFIEKLKELSALVKEYKKKKIPPKIKNQIKLASTAIFKLLVLAKYNSENIT